MTIKQARLLREESAFMEKEIADSFDILQDFIFEGLSESSAWMGRWIAQCAFELRPELRMDDKGRRYMVNPNYAMRER